MAQRLEQLRGTAGGAGSRRGSSLNASALGVDISHYEDLKQTELGPRARFFLAATDRWLKSMARHSSFDALQDARPHCIAEEHADTFRSLYDECRRNDIDNIKSELDLLLRDNGVLTALNEVDKLHESTSKRTTRRSSLMADGRRSGVTAEETRQIVLAKRYARARDAKVALEQQLAEVRAENEQLVTALEEQAKSKAADAASARVEAASDKANALSQAAQVLEAAFPPTKRSKMEQMAVDLKAI
ncbi:uncharacterized protein MONBRDRAFT_22626 [Monosiga brevicollis MX1]|uniref:Uncharacterized protein n=1 Tax=Monosiga brevicollis TaxID=81824 RepID=A9UNK5_MONBE|nr:uncharacterized protein MONBRDRAFT_22626 [Monosiga brevicollis MX1]EDQ92711.1 predicted protein [Monosiga brevicollis MX1]|eukprot:XP_001742473.1 hypothetical protein [Monosiga brevicollis MX1]